MIFFKWEPHGTKGVIENTKVAFVVFINLFMLARVRLLPKFEAAAGTSECP